MSTWEELASAALVGTDRRPYPGVLLEDAAVEVARRRAGRRPGPVAPPEPAPGEERPAVTRAAAGRLARILGGEHERLLPEWLAAAAATGRRVPPYVLPDLLERGRRDRSIRVHLGVLAGQRGRWLAGLNPAWAYLLEEPTGETWELGGPADRRAHLRALRAADPARARLLLESTWESETPDDRAEFVELLSEGLSMDDEPFLESALDDRRREVRQAAANLLTRLPESRLARRMAERVRGCAAVAGDLIVIEAPRACDRAMERDGVRPKPPRGLGERAWWLQQIIARAPLAVWGHPPERLLAMRIPDWDADVRTAWVRAAVLQRDPVWARAMFGWDPIADLLESLPPEEQQELAAGFARGHDLDSQLIMVLGGVSSPWKEELATTVLHKIVKVAATQPWNLGELVKLAGEHIDPALFPLAESYSPAEPIQQVAALLRFRADMHEELLPQMTPSAPVMRPTKEHP
ncbi:DUF5691 domain-containing protein [Actinomadura sp. ATCC 31491]|uniref:DUF5691 domain-containing protein n=1 Tax=Actinomadura luzonensis TaxID=2805427 RepID=A0ABT0FY83_9ACTN|nr:DUF5691 domain-containing protein [Actinomadura luzonensis]MCK2217311.1 DUF5691 domain-containing protein [Actinomadura luzonensis]